MSKRTTSKLTPIWDTLSPKPIWTPYICVGCHTDKGMRIYTSREHLLLHSLWHEFETARFQLVKYQALVNALLYYVTIPTHPNTTSQPSLWITAKVSTSAWAELVSACKGNENNRKVVSFPIIFFKKHKGSVVWRHTNNHKSPLSILLWTNHPAPPRSGCFANQHYALHHTKLSSKDGGSSSYLSLA